MLAKIISGGQTGADQAGLAFGKDNSYRTGGWAPRNWETEDGPQQTMLQNFGLKQMFLSGYAARTEANVRDSNGTVIFAKNLNSSGTKLTTACCHKIGRLIFYPVFNEFWQDSHFRDWLIKNKIKTLNVAGNRESITPGVYQFTYDFLTKALKEGN